MKAAFLNITEFIQTVRDFLFLFRLSRGWCASSVFHFNLLFSRKIYFIMWFRALSEAKKSSWVKVNWYKCAVYFGSACYQNWYSASLMFWVEWKGYWSLQGRFKLQTCWRLKILKAFCFCPAAGSCCRMRHFHPFVIWMSGAAGAPRQISASWSVCATEQWNPHWLPRLEWTYPPLLCPGGAAGCAGSRAAVECLVDNSRDSFCLGSASTDGQIRNDTQ